MKETVRCGGRLDFCPKPSPRNSFNLSGDSAAFIVNLKTIRRFFSPG
ncbi:MAG TPA: hypothetical protein VNI02_14320 [Blastocatellia bacterium]|nr:hypothetical protein [Blastocatellia bacterium]